MRGVMALPVEDTKEEIALDVNDKRDKIIGRVPWPKLPWSSCFTRNSKVLFDMNHIIIIFQLQDFKDGPGSPFA